MELANKINATPRSLAVALSVVAVLAAPVAHAGGKRPAPRPNLVVASVSDPPAAVGPAGSLPVSAHVKNQGAATARASATAFLLSLDATPSSDDLALGPPRIKTRAVRRGRSVTVQAVVAAPPLREGTYHLIACADAMETIRESSERDNCRASTGTMTIFYGVD